MTAEAALKGQVGALPSPIEASRQSWLTNAQTSAVVNGILVAVEVAFLQIVKRTGSGIGQTADDSDMEGVSTALRFFVYVGLTLSLGGATSSLIMVDILGEVPARFALRPTWPLNNSETNLDSLLDLRWTVAKTNRDLSRFVVMLSLVAQLILFIVSREPPIVLIPATVLVSIAVVPLVVMHSRSSRVS